MQTSSPILKPRLIKQGTQTTPTKPIAKATLPKAHELRAIWLTEAKRSTLTPRQQFAQLFT